MSNLISAAQIKAIAGAGARADLVAAIVNGWPTAVTKAKITTKLRAAHFIAQIMTETGGLKILAESGNYSAKRIMEIFGVGRHSAKVTQAEATRIAALPVDQRGPVLFNRVYGTGNPKKAREFNNTGPNDGWLYRGGGMMQATGKSNYALLEKKTGLPLVAHPELLHQPDSAFMAAYLEWAQGGRCNEAADRDDVGDVRFIINGGDNGIADCRVYLAKAKRALANYSAAAPVGAISAPSDDDEVTEEETAPSPIPVVVVDPDVKGDPELYSVQKRLKARNYSPGYLDGQWGGGTSGAISAFINDRGGQIPVPTSFDAFNDVREQIKAELSRAESENWVRPVSEARANVDPKTVAAIAPEVVPAKRNFWTLVSTAVVTFFTAVWDTITSWFTWLWDLFSDHKDDLPSSDSGFMATAWTYVQKVPHGVWWILAIAALVALAVNAHIAVKKINDSVKTGARQ